MKVKVEPESQGERAIRLWLEKNSIVYKQEAPNNLGYKFDFAVKSGRSLALIEFHGRQHYVPHDRHKDLDEFAKGLKRDYFKEKWCKDRGKNLLTIPYWDFDWIHDILSDFFMGRKPKFSDPPQIVKDFEFLRQTLLHNMLTKPGYEYTFWSESKLKTHIELMKTALEEKKVLTRLKMGMS